MHKKLFMLGVGVGLAIIAVLLTSETNKSTELQPTNTIPNIAISPTTKPLILFSPRSRLPFGGREVLPDYRFVALYGTPAFSGLGALGEQPLDQAISRAKATAEQYAPLSTEQVIPTFEIIVTVASADPTENHDYSQEVPIEKIKPWIDAAKANNMYVILDLQPGRSTFLEQAKLYEELLKEPHVGLALDPEWRLLTPQARHLSSIGSVTVDEINQTSAWLAQLIKDNNLPQKIFVIHQFRQDMVQDREALNTIAKELAFVIHMDGLGTLGQKIDTWNTLKVGLSDNVFMAWKNFIDEDKPTPTPQQTMSQNPKPSLITYQ